MMSSPVPRTKLAVDPAGGSPSVDQQPVQEQSAQVAPPTVPDGCDAIREFLVGSDRPKSAVYVPRRCREHRPGAGGSPLPTARRRGSGRQRPSSARVAGGLGGPTPPGTAGASGALKTERWREAGEMRWPVPVEVTRGDQQDVVPFRQTIDYSQGNWKNELWMRSLRKPGLILQDPIYATPGAEIREMHEEWRGCPPVSPRSVPFCGSTASGRAALPGENDPMRWVERPVATGKYAVNHMDGSRYKFDNTPRFYQDQAVGAASPPRVASAGAGRRTASSVGVTHSRRWSAKLCQA